MLAVDHIVIAAKDPEQAAKDFGNEHDVTIMKGGKHDNWGTYNYLAYFRNDCYIEWLGIYNEAIAAQSDNPLVQLLARRFEEGTEGVIQYALRTEQMNDFIENLQSLSVPFTGPVPGSRERPDGSLLEWRMLFPEYGNDVLPFLIEWGKEKNTPQSDSLINNKAIHLISTNIKDPSNFASIYQLSFSNDTAHLANADLQLSNGLNFSISYG
ncbi:VOC family protein [Lentibacillus cibarius]|uniref:VOC family protein n=1 Tax=Lentibacillus cibarius TaxID=2583219 RepID=A0A549YHK8_9BACI|nr:VOC family protein [Lentibacillus cibarius]TRM11354.1 VOC family protein [Lentibacillus cibarius]